MEQWDVEQRQTWWLWWQWCTETTQSNRIYQSPWLQTSSQRWWPHHHPCPSSSWWSVSSPSGSASPPKKTLYMYILTPSWIRPVLDMRQNFDWRKIVYCSSSSGWSGESWCGNWYGWHDGVVPPPQCCKSMEAFPLRACNYSLRCRGYIMIT